MHQRRPLNHNDFWEQAQLSEKTSIDHAERNRKWRMYGRYILRHPLVLFLLFDAIVTFFGVIYVIIVYIPAFFTTHQGAGIWQMLTSHWVPPQFRN